RRGVLPGQLRAVAIGDGGWRASRPHGRSQGTGPGRRAAMTIRIFVPLDAAALSVGAEAVASAVAAEIATRKLDAKLVRNGSRGLLWLEPLLEIETAEGRIGYGPVTPSDVKAILAAGPKADHPLKLGLVDAIPYLAKQQRLTFARCGITDPLSIEDYEAHGGLKGLRRALEMAPAAIVQEVTD